MAERKHKRVQRQFSGVTRTEQSHKDGLLIKKIIAKYNRTGILPQRLSQGVYGDFTSVQDYQESLNRIRDAEGDFAALPSEIRKRFHNSPMELIEFLSDDKNRKEAEELGIVPKKAEKAEEGVVDAKQVIGEKATDVPAKEEPQAAKV